MRNGLRICTFGGKKYYFHGFFLEGGFDRYPNDTMEGCMEITAVLEDENGNIEKVPQITEIKFEVEEKQ